MTAAPGPVSTLPTRGAPHSEGLASQPARTIHMAENPHGLPISILDFLGRWQPNGLIALGMVKERHPTPV